MLRSLTKTRPEESCVRLHRTMEIQTLVLSQRRKNCEDQAEYLAEEARVKSWKTSQRNPQKQKGRICRPRRHGNPGKGSHSRPSTSVGERECIIDSGASPYMMGTFSLCLVMTANRTVETIEEATVCIKGMDVFLCVKLLDDSPAVLPL